MKKNLVFILTICLLLNSFSMTIFAQEQKSNSEFVYNENGVDYIFERVEEDKQVTVLVKTIEGKIVNKIVLKDNILSVDGRVISKNVTNFMKLGQLNNSNIMAADSEWGPWLTFDETIIITGLNKLAIAAALFAIAPHIGVANAAYWASLIILSGYTEVTVSGKIRYRSDDEYHYYERYTTLVVNGNTELDSFYDTGKTTLN